MATWLSLGHGSAFGTFTIPHTINTPLRESLKALRKAYGFMNADRTVKSEMARLSIEGKIRALEITFGLNGWHPHLHTLWLTRNAPSDLDSSILQAVMLRAFNRSLAKQGYPLASERRGVLVLPLTLVSGKDHAVYLSKIQDGFGEASTVALEMTRSDLKKGRRKGRVPFEIGESAVKGNAQDLARWLEYRDDIKGAHALEWSPGLKGRLGLLEVSDEALAEMENSRGPLVASMSPQEYRLAVRAPGGQAVIFDLIEQGGAAALAEYIDALGDPAPAPVVLGSMTPGDALAHYVNNRPGQMEIPS
jgi:hypothetical protein